MTLCRLGNADDFDIDAERAGHGGAPLQFLHAFVRQCERDRSHALETGGDTRLRLQGAVELLTVLGEFGHVCRRTELPDQPRGVPCGARCQLLSLEQHHVRPAELGQMIGYRAAGDAASDDHHAGMAR